MIEFKLFSTSSHLIDSIKFRFIRTLTGINTCIYYQICFPMIDLLVYSSFGCRIKDVWDASISGKKIRGKLYFFICGQGCFASV